MAQSNLSHRRTHNLLLISKLLGQRDLTSPFTLILDSLESPARPLIREYVARAQVRSSPFPGQHFLAQHTRLSHVLSLLLLSTLKHDRSQLLTCKVIEMPYNLSIIRDPSDTSRREQFRQVSRQRTGPDFARSPRRSGSHDVSSNAQSA